MLGIDLRLQRYGFVALLAAALFGVSTPLAKLLLASASPWLLAGLLYLGSGLGLSALWCWRHWRNQIGRNRGDRNNGDRSRQHEPAPLSRADWPWLGGAVLSGGIVAPVLLMTGLQNAAASSAALLLNLEAVLTTVLAVVLFRESVSARVWLGAAVMVVAGLLLSWQDGVFSPAAIAVVAACFFWGVDNNLTRRIANNDALLLALVKGLVAGIVNITLALLTGAEAPSAWPLLAIMSLGFASFGVSLTLFVLALRHLGSARTAAHFSTAPFFGAGLALLLGEPVSTAFVVASVLMVFATWLVLSEHHEHEHQHEQLVHRHLHEHDDHHQHAHDGSEGPEPHDHEHVHEPMTHRHPHLPDIHHRHEH